MEHYEDIKKSLEKLIKLCNTLIVVVTLQTIVIALVLIGFGAGIISSYLLDLRRGNSNLILHLTFLTLIHLRVNHIVYRLTVKVTA